MKMRYSILAMQILEEAEKLFGPKISPFIYAGIDFDEVSNPRIEFDLSEKYVFILLTEESRQNFTQFVFQLSHEIIHLLSPRIVPKTSNLEEGLACYFSELMTINHTGNKMYACNAIIDTAYKESYLAVKELIREFPDCMMQLRSFQPYIGLIDASTFEKSKLNISEEKVQFLIELMDYGY